MKYGLTEVERRLQQQLPFLTAVTKMLQESGGDPKTAELAPFLKLTTDMERIVSGMIDSEPGAQPRSQSAANELWHLTRFVANGLRMYQLSPGLAELLIKTNVGRVQTDWIQLPFPSFYLSFPPGLDAYMYSIDGCKYPILGALITDQELGEGVSGSSLKAGRYMSLAFLAEGDQDDSILFSLHIYMDTDTLDDAMRAVIDRMGALLEKESIKLSQATERFKNWKQFLRQYKKDLTRMCNLVANAILYATCENPEITNLRSPRKELEARLKKVGPKKQSRLQRQITKTSGLDRQVLGGSIVVERGEKENTVFSTGSGHKVMVRHMVSGHWRNQPHGPGNELRRWKWIAPHWRGPDGAEEVVKRHILR